MLHAYNYTVTVAPLNCDVINYVKFILAGTVHVYSY